MSDKLVSFRMDSELKNNLDALCDAIGMSTTTAFTIFAKKMVAEQKIPFEVSADPFYSKENLNFLRKAKQALDNNKGQEHELIED